MPLVSTAAMLSDARAGQYAVAAFNVENMEMMQAVVSAAELSNAPVILQTTPGTLRYAAPAIFAAQARALAGGAPVPVALHLDHGDSLALVAKAVEAGYTSVMIDGSRLDFSGNIALTRSAVELCAPSGIPVEGELGRVGGKEDDSPDAGAGYTDPDEAARFVAETGVSSLAVGVGTSHGIYVQKPALNIPLTGRIAKCVATPLVLHGASGLSREEVRAFIARGICKVNFATELRMAYTKAVRAHLLENLEAIDPKGYGAAAGSAVRLLAMAWMAVCGCGGKA